MDKDLSRAVSADLAPIFRGPPPSPAAEPAAAIPTPAPRRRRDAAALAAGAVAIGLTGLAAGWLLARPGPPEPSVLRVAAAPPPVAPAPAGGPAPGLAPALPAASPAPAPVKPRAERVRPEAGLMARCSRLARGERAWCAHRVVMAQDRALRRSYDRAVRAGVPRAVLAGYTRRWAGLRRQAAAHPERVANGYAAMSRELSRRAQARGGGGGRRR